MGAKNARLSSEEICSEYAAQTFSKKNVIFYFQKKPSALNKSRISKYGLKKSKLATLLHV